MNHKTSLCSDGQPCGLHHCEDCPNGPAGGRGPVPDDAGNSSASATSSPAGHYRHTVRVPVTADDARRGYAVLKLDPYRVCDVYDTGGGPREQVIKKLLRWTDKGQSEDKVLDEIQAALTRWREMRAEDEAAVGEGEA